MLSESEMASVFRFGVKKASREDITSGQLHRPRLRKDVRFCNIFPGIDSNCLHFQKERLSSVEGKWPLRMDLRDENSHMRSHSTLQV